MKKLHYMAVLFQMFHVGIIRNRISKNLMSVSLQVTVNCLCHGSSVKTQHINEQLDTKQLHKISLSALIIQHENLQGSNINFRISSQYIQHIMNRTKFAVITICFDQQGNKFDPLQFCYFYKVWVQISWFSQDVSFTACENTLSHHH